MRLTLLSAFVAAATCTGPDLWAADAGPLAPGQRIRLATLAPPQAQDNPDAIVGSEVGRNREGITLRDRDGQLMTLARKNRDLTGILVASDDKALILQLPGVKEPVRVPRSFITGVRISHGRDWGVGAGIGALVGFAAGYISGSCNPDREWCGLAPGQAAVGMVFAVPGAVLGALATPERWEVVETERVKVGLGTSVGSGPGLNVSIRF